MHIQAAIAMRKPLVIAANTGFSAHINERGEIVQQSRRGEAQVLVHNTEASRRAILARLASGGATVNELSEPFDMSQPAISKHLKVLERAGLIACGHDAQRRPRTLNARPLAEAVDWIEAYRKHWEAAFARLDDVLEELLSARIHELASLPTGR